MSYSTGVQQIYKLAGDYKQKVGRRDRVGSGTNTADWVRKGVNRMLEKFTIWLAWKLPRSLAMWAAIRVMSHNMQEGPSVSMIETLTNWRQVAK